MIQIPFPWRHMMKEETRPTRSSIFLIGSAGFSYDGCLLSLVQTNYVLIIGVKADAERVAIQFGQPHGNDGSLSAAPEASTWRRDRCDDNLLEYEGP
jgi:hypothetical protein